MNRLVSIAGVPVSLTATDAARWAGVEALFGGCPEAAAPPAVSITYGTDPPPVPDRPADLLYPEAEVWMAPDGVAARHRSGTCGRRSDDRVEVGGPVLSDDPVRGFRQAVQHALLDALARLGRHALHAAALHRDGITLLVLGGSGAGKSTLSYAGARAGWHVLSDDLCLVGPAPDVNVAGFPKPVNVPGDTFADADTEDDADPAGPVAGAQRLADDDRARWVLPHDFISDHGSHPVDAVVLVGHAEAASDTEDIPPGPLRVEAVIGAMPLRSLPAYARAFFPLAARLSRLPMATYRHDRDPALRLDAAAAFLDEQWQRLRSGPDQ